jgi:hypothetical protein
MTNTLLWRTELCDVAHPRASGARPSCATLTLEARKLAGSCPADHFSLITDARESVPRGVAVYKPSAAGRPSNLSSARRFLSRRVFDFCGRLEPGTRDLAAQSGQQIDSVMKSALLVKTLQVRQQGRPRELHRFGCWPRRSSHGRDHFGYRPCTLAPRPAPKPITALSDNRSVLPLISFSGNRAAKFPKK